jgi:heme A synthase
VVLLIVVLRVGHVAFWRGKSLRIRVLGATGAALVLAQVLVGFLSVYLRLAVIPVSLHTLLAALLLTTLTALAAYTWAPSAIRGKGVVTPEDSQGKGVTDQAEVR